MRRTAIPALQTVITFSFRADTNVPLLGLMLPPARNNALGKSMTVKGSATYAIPARCFRRRNSDEAFCNLYFPFNALPQQQATKTWADWLWIAKTLPKRHHQTATRFDQDL